MTSDVLTRRAAEAGLNLDPVRDARIWVYYLLLAKWNLRVNLTGFRVSPDNVEAIDRLLIEPMLAAAHAGSGRTVADVGSGGGSPAIPFAIAAASRLLTMVESKERKSAFLREALRETGVSGEVHTVRFEAFTARPATLRAFEIVTVRAVRLDRALLEIAAKTLAPGGRLFWFHEQDSGPSEGPDGLDWQRPIPLVPSLRSCLSIARKSDVSRET